LPLDNGAGTLCENVVTAKILNPADMLGIYRYNDFTFKRQMIE
jgi:hypothetical protein